MTLCACRPGDSFGCHFIGIDYFYWRQALSLTWRRASWPASSRESTCLCLPGDWDYREPCCSCAFAWILKEKWNAGPCACKAGIFWLSYLPRGALVILRYTAIFSEDGSRVYESVLLTHPIAHSLLCPQTRCPLWAGTEEHTSSLLGLWGSCLRLMLFESILSFWLPILWGSNVFVPSRVKGRLIEFLCRLAVWICGPLSCAVWCLLY